MMYNICIRCGRKLMTDRARNIGYGPICEHKQESKSKPLFVLQNKTEYDTLKKRGEYNGK